MDGPGIDNDGVSKEIDPPQDQSGEVANSYSPAKTFVEQLIRRAEEPLHRSYAGGVNLEQTKERRPNLNETNRIVNDLNDTRRVATRQYDELASDPNALEAFVKECGTKLSSWRKEAVDERIVALLEHGGKHFAQFYERRADERDKVAEQVGEATLDYYQRLAAGEEVESSDDAESSPIAVYLEELYSKNSGFQEQEQAYRAEAARAGEAGDTHKKEHQLREADLSRSKARITGLHARNAYKEVHGFPPAVKALVRYNTVVNSEAWKEYNAALQRADKGETKYFEFRRTSAVQAALNDATRHWNEAQQAGNTAVAEFETFQQGQMHST